MRFYQKHKLISLAVLSVAIFVGGSAAAMLQPAPKPATEVATTPISQPEPTTTPTADPTVVSVPKLVSAPTIHAQTSNAAQCNAILASTTATLTPLGDQINQDLAQMKQIIANEGTNSGIISGIGGTLPQQSEIQQHFNAINDEVGTLEAQYNSDKNGFQIQLNTAGCGIVL